MHTRCSGRMNTCEAHIYLQYQDLPIVGFITINFHNVQLLDCETENQGLRSFDRFDILSCPDTYPYLSIDVPPLVFMHQDGHHGVHAHITDCDINSQREK